VTHLKTLILALVLSGCATDDLSDSEEEVDEEEGSEIHRVPTHNPELCPGGSGGPGGKPIPAPRDCTKELTWELCYACCDWNAKHSWGAMCKRLKEPERAACWMRLESERRPACYKACGRPGGPITSVAP
jgi:hypothetical protein